MSKIQVLSPHVADLIAAGEVVERPASVVKELTENSIDAGATAITIEINDGGSTYIRITDNGCGMSPQDAATAFLRHATSKLRDEYGLEAIATLGFRGEALAAISSVSQIELLTRETGADEGTNITIDGGKIISATPAGCPEGTTFIVRNLFYNTPARKKFLKTDRAEASSISGVVTRIALSHPEISFRYIRDGKEELRTPGDGRLDSVVYSVFGRDFARDMLKTEASDENFTVTGFICVPSSCKGNRTSQYFFVNGRNIKSKTLQAALEQAYKNSLFTGRYPSCVLYIKMSTAAVDVNVHPTKTEVRFLREREVFDAVYYACLSALTAENPGSAEIKLSPESRRIFTNKPEPPKSVQPAQIQIPPVDEKPRPPKEYDFSRPSQRTGAGYSGTLSGKVAPKSDFFKTVSADTYRSGGGFKTSIPPTRNTEHFASVSDSGAGRHVGYNFPGDTPVKPIEKPQPKDYDFSRPSERVQNTPVFTPDIAEQETLPQMPEAKPFRYIGEAMDTYIIVESGSSLWLIDKHAAHERMNFDKLKASGYKPMIQRLIIPVICKLSAEDIALLSENGEVLTRFGLEIEQYSENSVALRQLPIDIPEKNVQSLLEKLCDDLRAGGNGDETELLDNIMHTIACKAAIKAGKATEPGELDGLITAVLSGDVRYCPHGRPVAVELTKATLDKSFKRTL